MKIPKYKNIAQIIKNRILEGKYLLENPLPDQITLAKEFNVSRATVQKALQLLTMEGWIYSIQGSGTFIKKNALVVTKEDIDIRQNGFSAIMHNRNTNTKVLKFDIRLPNEMEMEKLMINQWEAVYDIKRLRYVDDEPHVLEYAIFPVNVVKGLTGDIAAHSIFQYIQKDLHLHIGGVHKVIKADKPTEEDIIHLCCDKCDPILEVEHVVFLSNGQPFELSKNRHRHDNIEFSFVDFF